MHWYVLQVLSGQEKKIKKSLDEHRASRGVAEFIEEILLPVEQVSEVKRGQQKISEKRLWPGYLLIKMVLNDDTWMYVKSTNGVIDFLGGNKAEPLTDIEVGNLLADLENKEQKVSLKHQFNIGDQVKINDGVFKSFVGVVTDVYSDKQRLSVQVPIFDREARVDNLEFWQVEEAVEA